MINELLDTIKQIEREVQKRETRLDLLLSDKKKETKSVYLCHIRKFHSWRRKVTYDEWDVREFLRYLQDKGYSSSSIGTAYWALKLYFESEGWEWRLKKPKLSSPIPKEAISKEDVIRLIQVSLLRGTAEEMAYLALSTTYGLRRAEMANLTQDDFDWQAKTVFIRTKKGGTPRKHLIPDPIVNILVRQGFGRVPSTSYISLLFKRICQNAGLAFEKGTSWHSLRHRLNIELVEAGLPEIMILNFTRHKYRQSMVSYYYTPELRDLDSQVFRVHPFLKYYEEV